MAILPMFPLGGVLVPGAVLPLHVFEPRYRALVRDCLDAPDHEFGVVLIERGSEVGGGDQRTTVGTVARMVQVAELDGQRFAVVAVGTRRIQIREWLADDPYPRAEVEDWPDEDDDALGEDLTALYTEVAARVRRSVALAIELGDHAGDTNIELADDLVAGSYQLCALAPLGPSDAYDLLCAASPRRRLELLALRLDDLDMVHRFRLGNDEEMPDASDDG